jgi:hypothetical protein
MKTQQTELEERLERDGWKVVDRDCSSYWWAHEIWRIESKWKPVRKHLWIAFLVDQSSEWAGPSGKHVWAVSVARSNPTSLEEASEYLEPIRHRWAESLERLAEHIRGLRDEPEYGDSADVVNRGRRAARTPVPVARLKTIHEYHDAEIRRIEFESGDNLVLEVQLAPYSDLHSATVHLIFLGVRNGSEVQAALASARRMWSDPCRDLEIIGIGRDKEGEFVLDLDGGSVTICARGFTET